MKDIVAEVPRLICTANYACRKELGQEAIYICHQCASLQCSKCESELHRTSSNRTHHQRLKIDDLDDESCSCSMNSTHEATIFCNECEKKFCKNCFDKRHQQTDKRYHTPMIYQDDLRNKTEIRTMKVPSSTNDKHNETFEDVEVDTSDDSPNSPEYSLNQSPKRNHIDREMLAQSLLEMHDNQQDMNEPDVSTAFLLLDGNEALTVKNKSEFLQKLNVNDHAPSVKCVSIVGNTGHGKSYTLNQIFFNGKDVFRTSSAPDSCTMGVWASLDENQQALVLDTEGLLGQTANVRTRNRLLLKIMCLSDIIIYRINAPRLTNDMFEFLSEASKAFSEYFQKELESVLKNSNVNGLKSLPGPSLVIFHETHNTDVLKEDFKQQKTPIQQIKERFENMGLHYSSYQSIDYVGTRTSSGEKTNFEPIKSTITSILEDKNNRSLRSLSIFYTALKALNEKFSHTIPLTLPSTLLDDFFACNHKCLACGSKCSIVANHLKENLPHECNKNKSCIYNPDVDNEVWKCRACLYEGVHTIVYGKLITKNDGLLQGLIRYVWSGFVIECPKHGEIYRSRKYWYGNSDPRDVTQVDIIHVWQGEKTNRDASDVTPRKCMEILASAGSFLSAPTKIISQTITDQVAPSYWVPNKDAKKCANCSLVFGSDYSKHHCRSCGKVFCDTCSKKRRVVPWVDSESSVRVCDKCADKPEMDPPPSITSSVERNNQLVENNNSSASNAVEIPISRRVYETIVTSLEKINANYPIELLKDSARPNYWQPDHKCLTCVVCEQPFNNTTNRLHHCRNCGYGVCELCSPYKRCVPERDWFTPVRVCKNCNETMSEQTSERK